MNAKVNATECIPKSFVDSIQPIVLVGGASRRFGRDKLREPWQAQPLVQRPIEALRTFFGMRVKLVGKCDASILTLADGVMRDLHPGIGPMGGIVSALDGWNGAVFVLAGDMPNFTQTHIQRIVAAAYKNPLALAALAYSDRLHPCAGLYQRRSLDILSACIAKQKFKLVEAIAIADILRVTCDAQAVVNINRMEDVPMPSFSTTAKKFEP